MKSSTKQMKTIRLTKREKVVVPQRATPHFWSIPAVALDRRCYLKTLGPSETAYRAYLLLCSVADRQGRAFIGSRAARTYLETSLEKLEKAMEELIKKHFTKCYPGQYLRNQSSYPTLEILPLPFCDKRTGTFKLNERFTKDGELIKRNRSQLKDLVEGFIDWKDKDGNVMPIIPIPEAPFIVSVGVSGSVVVTFPIPDGVEAVAGQATLPNGTVINLTLTDNSYIANLGDIQPGKQAKVKIIVKAK